MTFIHTFFEQCLYTEFETYVCEAIETSAPHTNDEMNTQWSMLNKKYWDNNPVVEKSAQWMDVASFFKSNYEPLSYALAFVIASAITDQIYSDKTSIISSYIRLLKSGTSKELNELLSCLNIDLHDSSLYEKFLEKFDSYLILYEKQVDSQDIK